MARIAEAVGRYRAGRLSCGEAAELLGMSERHFRRLRDRYELEGAEGLIDRRRGRASGRRAPVDRIEWVLAQYRTRSFDFTAKHFHERLVSEQGFEFGYTWTKLALQKAGLVKRAAKRSAHRRKRPRRPLPGMMLFQACPRAGVAGPVGRLDAPLAGGSAAARPDRDPGRCDQRDLLSLSGRGGGDLFELPGACGGGDRGARAVPVALQRPGQPLLPHAQGRREGGEGPADRGRASAEAARPTGPAAPARGQAIEHIPSYSPEARGRMERVFGTLQRRLPQELRLAGITTVEAANGFLAERLIPGHNGRFAVAAAEPGSAFVPFAGALAEILCVQAERVVGNDNCVRYAGLSLQIPEQAHRHHFVKVTVRVHRYADGRLAVFHGPRRLARYDADGRRIAEEQARSAA